MLLTDYSKAWLQERTVRGRPLAPRTTDTYRHSLNMWALPTLGDVLLEKGQLRIERQAVEVDGEGARNTEPKASSRRTVNLPILRWRRYADTWSPCRRAFRARRCSPSLTAESFAPTTCTTHGSSLV